MISDDEVQRLHEELRSNYEQEISKLVQGWKSEKQSLTIEYSDVFSRTPDLADRLTEQPDEAFKDLNHVVETFDYPVEFDGTPEVEILGSEYERAVEQLRQTDVGNYLTVRGQVNQITQVVPKVVRATFICQQCGNRVKVIQSEDSVLEKPDTCETCNGQTVWETDDQATVYQDHQVFELSSLPEDTAGQTSDSIKVEVTNDLAGRVTAGDRVKVSGILKTESEDVKYDKHPDARRDLYLDARAIKSEQESFSEVEPTQLEQIKEMAGRDDIYQLLIDSFAPHIHTDDSGDMQKLAIMLALFGGVQKQLDTGSQIRGNINILLVGDAGTAKSQYLKTAEKIAPKSVLASGKGARAAGLTATAEQSNLTGEWTLKPGALVLANNGIACIDEFDKMQDSARKSIHEALENQEIPISKAGINTTLPARTAVIAAANPEGGEYDRFAPLTQQVDMERPLISRFDLKFGISDDYDEQKDREIAQTQHDIAAGNEDSEPVIEYSLLREYIAYARQVEPVYKNESVRDELIDFYLDIREETAENDGELIGPRMNDSLRRIAQASARVRLSETINHEDAERAIRLMRYTIGQMGFDENGELSGTQLSGGRSKPKTQQGRINHIRQVIDTLQDGEPAAVDAVYDESLLDNQRTEQTIEKLKQNGEIYEPKTDAFRTT